MKKFKVKVIEHPKHRCSDVLPLGEIVTVEGIENDLYCIKEYKPRHTYSFKGDWFAKCRFEEV